MRRERADNGADGAATPRGVGKRVVRYEASALLRRLTFRYLL
jgi:hypothetical protein